MQVYTISSKKLWENGRVLASSFQPQHRVNFLKKEKKRLESLIERHQKKVEQLDSEIKAQERRECSQ